MDIQVAKYRKNFHPKVAQKRRNIDNEIIAMYAKDYLPDIF